MVNLGRSDNLMKNKKRDAGITKSDEANKTTKTPRTPRKTSTPTTTPTPIPIQTITSIQSTTTPLPPPSPNPITVNSDNNNDKENDDNHVKEQDPISRISPIAVAIMISIVVLIFLIIGILLYRKYLYYQKLRKLDEDGLKIQPRTVTSHLNDNNHRLNIGNGGNDGTANNKNNAYFNDSTVVGSGIGYDENSLGSTKKLPNKPPVIELNRISSYLLKIDYNKFGYSKRNTTDSFNNNANHNNPGGKNDNANRISSTNLTHIFPIPPQRTARFYNIRDSIHSKFK